MIGFIIFNFIDWETQRDDVICPLHSDITDFLTQVSITVKTLKPWWMSGLWKSFQSWEEDK